MRNRNKMLMCFTLLVGIAAAVAASDKEADAAVLCIWRGELNNLLP
jgi:hypothetical protein